MRVLEKMNFCFAFFFFVRVRPFGFGVMYVERIVHIQPHSRIWDYY